MDVHKGRTQAHVDACGQGERAKIHKDDVDHLNEDDMNLGLPEAVRTLTNLFIVYKLLCH